MTACPVCSGATDVPDGKGGIMPCPECSQTNAGLVAYRTAWSAPVTWRDIALDKRREIARQPDWEDA